MFCTIGFVSMLSGLGLFAFFIITILGILSVTSWGIIIIKLKQFDRISRADLKFLDFFSGVSNIFDLTVNEYPESSYGRIYDAAVRNYHEFAADARARDVFPLAMVREDIESAVLTAAEEEINNLERYNIFLATTASVSPFLGLLGTVWGIMDAFISMGYRGSSSIGVVAPGIAEALITTILGLAVAIPAVVAHNYFTGRTRNYYSEMKRFVNELAGKSLKELLK